MAHPSNRRADLTIVTTATTSSADVT